MSGGGSSCSEPRSSPSGSLCFARIPSSRFYPLIHAVVLSRAHFGSNTKICSVPMAGSCVPVSEHPYCHIVCTCPFWESLDSSGWLALSRFALVLPQSKRRNKAAKGTASWLDITPSTLLKCSGGMMGLALTHEVSSLVETVFTTQKDTTSGTHLSVVMTVA